MSVSVCFHRPLAVYKRMKLKLVQLEFFGMNDWRFVTDNCKVLHKTLNTKDENLFNFQMDKLDWQEYFCSYGLGIRRHIFNEDDSTLPMAQKKMKILYRRNKMFQFLLIILLLLSCGWLVIKLVNCISY